MAKDFEELRKEQKDLSDQLRRGGILALTILSLFVISFTRACEKANGSDATKTLCQIDKMSKISGYDRDVSYIFNQFAPDEEACGDPCPTTSANPSPITQNSSANPREQQTQPASSGHVVSNVASPNATPSPTEAQRQVAYGCQKKLEVALEASAEKWFAVEAPIPGVRISLDLRYWIFLLPPLFFLSGIYLHTLRMKLRVVNAVAAYKLSTSTPEATEVDRLYFDKQSAYGRFPASTTGTLFVIIYVLLPVYLILSTYSFWGYWSAGSWFGFGLLFAILSLYSVSYAHFVTNRLNEEIARATHSPMPRNFIVNARNKSRNVIQTIARRVSPRISLSTGSVLLFLTLGMAITQSSCEKTSYTGYEVLVGAAHWYTSYGLFDDASTLISLQGRIMYASALLLALVAAVLVIRSSLYCMLVETRVRKVLLLLIGGVWVLTIIDFSFGRLFALSGKPVSFWLWLIFMAIWLRYSLFEQQRRKWLRIRPPITILCIPFFAIAFIFTLQNLMLPGLLVYFTGVNLLFLGLIQIPYASEAVARQPEHEIRQSAAPVLSSSSTQPAEPTVPV